MYIKSVMTIIIVIVLNISTDCFSFTFVSFKNIAIPNIDNNPIGIFIQNTYFQYKKSTKNAPVKGPIIADIPQQEDKYPCIFASTSLGSMSLPLVVDLGIISRAP